MLKLILKFFKALNSNTSPSALALGFSLGLLMGQYPAGTIQWLALLLLILFVFKINLPAYTSFLILFVFIPPFLHPLADRVGTALLSGAGLQELLTTLYNDPVWYMTKFYNSVVLGFTVIFIPGLLIFYFLFKWLVKLYREKLQPKIIDSKFYKAFMKLSIISKIAKLGSNIEVR